MCINPSPLKSGVSIACRKCWQCRENRVHDWVGRCIAETKTAAHAVSVTMTYGRDVAGNVDHERAAVLTYSDVQKYLKRLRFAGYRVKYFAAGEYGSEKGRAHWHAILFFYGKLPTFKDGTAFPWRQNFDDPFWSDENGRARGFSFWDEVNYKSIRYVCKYLQKADDDAKQGYVAMSRRPPIGSEYFDRLALDYATAGLAPQSPFYSFSGVERNGEKINFMLRDASLDLFLAAYLRHWERLHGGHCPVSELVEDYLDRTCKINPDTPILLDRSARFIRRDKTQREKQWLRENQGAGNVSLRNSPTHNASAAAYRAASARSSKPAPSHSRSPSGRR